METQYVFCSNCGAKNVAGSHYCIRCGKPLTGYQQDSSAQRPEQKPTTGTFTFSLDRIRRWVAANKGTVILGALLAFISALVSSSVGLLILLGGIAAIVVLSGLATPVANPVEPWLSRHWRAFAETKAGQVTAQQGILNAVSVVLAIIVLGTSYIGTFIRIDLSSMGTIGSAFVSMLTGESSAGQLTGGITSSVEGMLNGSLKSQLGLLVSTGMINNTQMVTVLGIIALGPILVIVGSLLHQRFSDIVVIGGAAVGMVVYGFIANFIHQQLTSTAGLTSSQLTEAQMIRQMVKFGPSALVAFFGVGVILLLALLRVFQNRNLLAGIRKGGE
ncbi:zinc ribbon domain-containing protein [Schleiferilactobacillus shenzhenensis]|nr:zinc ribbon domain-containing protein [Schleiferilactobacillus shenzhenensis]